MFLIVEILSFAVSHKMGHEDKETKVGCQGKSCLLNHFHPIQDAPT